MKQTGKALLAAALLAAEGIGCVVPGQPSRTMQWVDPEPDGYYTGKQHDFAERFNPDPQGRKFRVSFVGVHLQSVDGVVGGDAVKSASRKSADVFFGDYLGFREQARESRHARYYQSGPGEAFKASVKSQFALERSKIALYLAAARVVAAGGWDSKGGVLGESDPNEFMRHRTDADCLTAELASRYPALFTTKDNGFPLEIAMIGLYTQSDPVVRTRFEAWLIGLPEHATLDNWTTGVLFPSEVFLSPYEAIAAALFKLTDEQFEGLEPANPKDRELMEGP